MTKPVYQRPSGKNRYSSSFPSPFSEAPMLNSCRRLLRMEENVGRQNPLFYRDERRGPIRFRGSLGWLAKSQYQAVPTNLPYHHPQTTRVVPPKTYSKP